MAFAVGLANQRKLQFSMCRQSQENDACETPTHHRWEGTWRTPGVTKVPTTEESSLTSSTRWAGGADLLGDKRASGCLGDVVGGAPRRRAQDERRHTHD